MSDDTRTCAKCGHTKPTSAFRKKYPTDEPDLKNICIECTKAYAKAYKEKYGDFYRLVAKYGSRLDRLRVKGLMRSEKWMLARREMNKAIEDFKASGGAIPPRSWWSQ